MLLFHSIQLQNFLSYGEESRAVELRDLNVIIGPNGSGKSNLIEAVELLRAAPKDLRIPIRDGGGVQDWLWQGEKTPVATINAVFDYPPKRRSLRYLLGFTEVNQNFRITDERIEEEHPSPGHETPYFYYKFMNGRGILNVRNEVPDKNEQPDENELPDKIRKLELEDIDPVQSILSQRKDPNQYPELTDLGKTLAEIRLYREWCFGRYTTLRMPQKTDLPDDFLEPDASNLYLVLNNFQKNLSVRDRFMDALRDLYEGIDGSHFQVQGGTIQMFLRERQYLIPATRLSDGTLRYLCLLAILCHPDPPPLVCIEEPELGLHPDVLPTLADLMKEASERCQLIVTTHSDVLVDALTDRPESVLVAEKTDQGTTLTRLDAEKLRPWLEEYRLGQLWTQGEIGGMRW